MDPQEHHCLLQQCVLLFLSSILRSSIDLLQRYYIKSHITLLFWQLKAGWWNYWPDTQSASTANLACISKSSLSVEQGSTQLAMETQDMFPFEEQLAIFLYTCVTGLSVWHVGEQFQRLNSTISQWVKLFVMHKDVLIIIIVIFAKFSSLSPLIRSTNIHAPANGTCSSSM